MLVDWTIQVDYTILEFQSQNYITARLHTVLPKSLFSLTTSKTMS